MPKEGLGTGGGSSVGGGCVGGGACVGDGSGEIGDSNTPSTTSGKKASPSWGVAVKGSGIAVSEGGAGDGVGLWGGVGSAQASIASPSTRSKPSRRVFDLARVFKGTRVLLIFSCVIKATP